MKPFRDEKKTRTCFENPSCEKTVPKYKQTVCSPLIVVSAQTQNMEDSLTWNQLRDVEAIRNLYNEAPFPWELRDALGDTLLEAALDEKNIAGKQKLMQHLQTMCSERDPNLGDAFNTYTTQFEKKSQAYSELKKLIQRERKIVNALDVPVPEEILEPEIEQEPMEVDPNPIFEILDAVKQQVSQLPQ